MAHIVIAGLNFFLLPMEVFAGHFPNMLQRLAARPGLRTTAAIPLTTPSHSSLDTSSSETTRLAPFPLDLGRRQQITPTVQSMSLEASKIPSNASKTSNPPSPTSPAVKMSTLTRSVSSASVLQAATPLTQLKPTSASRLAQLLPLSVLVPWQDKVSAKILPT